MDPLMLSLMYKVTNCDKTYFIYLQFLVTKCVGHAVCRSRETIEI